MGVLLVIFIGIATIIGVIKYFNYKKELLDRAVLNPEQMEQLVKPQAIGNEALRFGLLFIGIALGVLTGSALLHYGIVREELFAFLTGVFFFGGFGLIIGYIIEQKNEKKVK